MNSTRKATVHRFQSVSRPLTVLLPCGLTHRFSSSLHRRDGSATYMRAVTKICHWCFIQKAKNGRLLAQTCTSGCVSKAADHSSKRLKTFERTLNRTWRNTNNNQARMADWPAG